MEKETGTIARLMDKGYGFIAREGQDKDLFFHARSLTEGLMFDDLREGDAVTFLVEETDKGLNAVDIEKA